MYEFTVSKALDQITDGHPARAAAAARRATHSRRFEPRERVVLAALLRHAQEESLKERLLGERRA